MREVFAQEQEGSLKRKSRMDSRPYPRLTWPAKSFFAACSDDTYPFKKHLEEGFLWREGDYFEIRLAGGLVPLAHRDLLPDDFDYLVKHLGICFNRLRPDIDHFTYFGHIECGFVRDQLPQFFGKEEEDTLAIARQIEEQFPGRFKRINLHFAFHQGEKQVRFRHLKHQHAVAV